MFSFPADYAKPQGGSVSFDLHGWPHKADYLKASWRIRTAGKRSAVRSFFAAKNADAQIDWTVRGPRAEHCQSTGLCATARTPPTHHRLRTTLRLLTHPR